MHVCGNNPCCACMRGVIIIQIFMKRCSFKKCPFPATKFHDQRTIPYCVDILAFHIDEGAILRISIAYLHQVQKVPSVKC